MSVLTKLTVVLCLVATDLASAGDFPQWRGAQRDGVVKDSPPLADSFGKSGPPVLWESEVFPKKSGQGSPVIANGRVLLYVNWPVERELKERHVTESVLLKSHWFDVEKMPADLLEKAEKARATIPPKLRGRELDQFSRDWIEKNVLTKEHRRWRATISRRFKAGPDAIPLPVVKKLGEIRDRRFPDAESLEAWLDESKIDRKLRTRLLRNVKTSSLSAEDVLLCVNLSDGKTAWKYRVEGSYQDREGSGTPCIHDGRVYFLGTTHAHCVDLATGKGLWATELSKGGCPSSFVVAGDKAIVSARHLMAFDRQSGKIVWEAPKVRSRDSSPSLWKHGGKDYVLLNADGRKLTCVDAQNGEVLWAVKGGGASCPVVTGDIAVLHSNDGKLGVVAYRLFRTGAESMWTLPRKKSRGASTPIVSGDTIYVFGGDEALCLGLSDGKQRWRKSGRVEISSPLLVDGKIVSVAGNGKQLWLLKAGGKGEQISKSRLAGTRCASPAIADGRLILRLNDRLTALDLREKATP